MTAGVSLNQSLTHKEIGETKSQCDCSDRQNQDAAKHVVFEALGKLSRVFDEAKTQRATHRRQLFLLAGASMTINHRGSTLPQRQTPLGLTTRMASVERAC